MIRKGYSDMLNDMKCRTASPRTKTYKLSDSEGLYLEVTPNGSKLWRLKYRFAGSEKRIALGSYPKVSLLQVRQDRDTCKAHLRDGIDPVLERLRQKQTATLLAEHTFEAVTLEWIEKNSLVWSERYTQTVLHRFKKYILPHLGRFPISQITPLMILACLQKIERNAPYMAQRMKTLVRNVFNYAIPTGRLQFNPTNGIEQAMKKHKSRHFAAISLDELPKFLFDLFEYRSRVHRQTFLAIYLMMLTFVRTSELIEAKWKEIDFEKAMWIIPAERMKMKLPHMVPLSKQALKMFAELKDMNGLGEYVFPSFVRSKKTMSKFTILVALKRMGYKNRMTGHGFRSLALGVLKEKLKYAHHVADRQLAHVPQSNTDRAYDRAQYLDDRIVMMQHYADYLDKTYIETLIATKQS